MDGLLAEINKRKAEDFGESSGGGASSKYMRRADLERARVEDERRKRDEAKKAKTADEATRAARLRKEADSRASSSRLATPRGSNTPEPASVSEVDRDSARDAIMSMAECAKRLRARGQVVRFFGETDRDVRVRLRALELGEGRAGVAQNDFQRAADERARLEAEREAREEMDQVKKARPAAAPPAERGGSEPAGADKDADKGEKYRNQVLDLDLVRTDFNKVHPAIYWAFKHLLKEWEEYLDSRPDDVKRTAAGKLAATNQVQSAHNMKPLFKELRQRTLQDSLVRHLAEVVHHIQTREYQKANDAYLRMSIGNAAWPIGVVSVGIHERSSEEKIYNNVAHVLNDEVSRKYIQAVKRLMTFAQMVRPPTSMAQAMG